MEKEKEFEKRNNSELIEKKLEKITAEKEQNSEEEDLILPEKVEHYGNLVFFFKILDGEDFMKALADFKENNPKIRITSITPLWECTQRETWKFGQGFCVNCEKDEG